MLAAVCETWQANRGVAFVKCMATLVYRINYILKEYIKGRVIRFTFAFVDHWEL